MHSLSRTRRQLIIECDAFRSLSPQIPCRACDERTRGLRIRFLLVGCAIREFPITYVPQQNLVAIKNANAVSVEVKVEDLQPAESMSWDAVNPISQKNDFRVKDASDAVKTAAETELRARGFKIGNGGALVTIQLGRLEALCEDDWSGLTALGYVSMRVQVQPQTGKVLYSREIKGEANPLFATFYLRCATPELQGALSDAFRRLFADPVFTTAILATH